LNHGADVLKVQLFEEGLMLLPSESLCEATCNHIGCCNPFNFETCIGIAIPCISTFQGCIKLTTKIRHIDIHQRWLASLCIASLLVASTVCLLSQEILSASAPSSHSYPAYCKKRVKAISSRAPAERESNSASVIDVMTVRCFVACHTTGPP
jgi:hypothetical protein